MSQKMSTKCPKCGLPIIAPAGPGLAEIGLMGEFPGIEEKRQGAPFVGVTGRLLRTELARFGIPLWECKATNLWGHDPVEKDDAEFDFHFGNVVKFLKTCKYLLLMGSEVSHAFLGENVTDITGLNVKCTFFPNAVIIVPSPNPAILMHSTLGEFRFALQRFSELTTKEKERGRKNNKKK